jgi:hypothetical protein
MIRKSLLAAASLALVFTAATPFAAENNYVPTRTILQQTDVPGSNYTVILALTDIAPGMVVARATPILASIFACSRARATSSSKARARCM